MKILFLAPYPKGQAPSQRFRFEQYLPYFSQRGHSYEFRSFWSKRGWNALYRKGKNLQKALYLFSGFVRRFILLFTISKYDFIFIHREAAPVGPPVFELMISRFFKKKLIYDFDDAIWLPNTSEVNQAVSKLKFHQKVSKICQFSWKVSVGNFFLQDYAKKFNQNVIINPTVVDTDHYHSQTKHHEKKEKPIVGWTGTHSTAQYLKMVTTVMNELKKELDFEWVTISNQPPELDFDNIKFIPWNKTDEIHQLLKFDIGIMPLEDSIWEKGKCGFKLIQYLSLGIPAVASPVGVNSSIIEEGKNGYLANTEEEWKQALKRLIQDASLRNWLGMNGRTKVTDQFSVRSNLDLFFSTFE